MHIGYLKTVIYHDNKQCICVNMRVVLYWHFFIAFTFLSRLLCIWKKTKKFGFPVFPWCWAITNFKMASSFLTRSVRPAFTVFLRPFLTSSSAYSASRGEVVIDKTDKSVDTIGDDKQVRIFIYCKFVVVVLYLSDVWTVLLL